MKAWAAFAVGAFLAILPCPLKATSGYPSAGVQRPQNVPVLEAWQDAEVQAKLDRLVVFTPDRPLHVVDRVARGLQRELGGSRAAYERFLRARLHDFQSIVARYGMRPNDLSTARAFAIVVGYKAYNGDHLKDTTSGSIFRTMLALQTAAPQWYEPWSDTRKQELYVTWALQGAVLNWLDDESRLYGDPAEHALVRSEARAFLQRQLGRNPDTVKLDKFACTLYRDEDCTSLMRRLRAEFAGAFPQP